jgi:hypothetical protein
MKLFNMRFPLTSCLRNKYSAQHPFLK